MVMEFPSSGLVDNPPGRHKNYKNFVLTAVPGREEYGISG